MNNFPMLPPPEPDADMDERPPIQRAARMLAFRFRQFEHWLSPDGSIRAWVRWCLRFAFLLLIPTALIVPVLIFALRGLAVVFATLVRLCLDALLVLAALIGMLLLFAVLRELLRAKRR